MCLSEMWNCFSQIKVAFDGLPALKSVSARNVKLFQSEQTCIWLFIGFEKFVCQKLKLFKSE